MGNRAECPACKAYGSDVYADLHFNYSNCRKCGCPHALLMQWDEMQLDLDEVREKKTTKDLVKRIDELFCENAALKAKISKLYDLLAFQDLDELFSPIMKAKNILEND